MAGNRSEANAVGNSKFTDLNMTFYPTKVDSKVAGDVGFNPNMKGFWSAGDSNMPAGKEADYNMAEHVNALADAIMSIQRILGVNPHIDFKGGNATGTVSTRIAAAENKDAYYDVRYGGQNWSPAIGQTILTHTHGGGINQAPKIQLGSEVAGRLLKANLDLAQATGVTGADISMSPAISTKVVDAVNDKLSTSQGGIIKKGLTVEGRLLSRTHKEWTAEDISGGTLVSDMKTLTGVSRRGSGTGQVQFINGPVNNLLCGKYVLGVRAKVNSLVSQDVLRLHFGDYNGSQWINRATKIMKGTDFSAINQWQMFYMVFDHETLTAEGLTAMHVWKTTTTSSINLDIDCVWITPVHPAVFDK
jgi:hypothetical protein